METPDIIGSIGVGLLLLAFALSTFLGLERRLYHGLNLVGAGLACLSAYLIGFAPFVVLEGVWALVAAIALVRPAGT